MYIKKNETWSASWIISDTPPFDENEEIFHPMKLVFIYPTSAHSHNPYIGITVIEAPQLANTLLLEKNTYL